MRKLLSSRTELRYKNTDLLLFIARFDGRAFFYLVSVSTSAEVESHFSQEKCQNCHSSSGLLMSRLAVVAKGTPVVLRQNVGALSRSSASRDGESGIIGKQNLYYAIWFTKTLFQPNRSDSPRIHFFSRRNVLVQKIVITAWRFSKK